METILGIDIKQFIMNTITFEVTKNKTLVVATGTVGNVEKIDITDTELETELTVLLKKISKYWKEKQIFDAINTVCEVAVK